MWQLGTAVSSGAQLSSTEVSWHKSSPLKYPKDHYFTYILKQAEATKSVLNEHRATFLGLL